MILRKKKSLNAGPIYGTGEGVAHSKRWYVALVRMHHEKKVSEYLNKVGIENFVPVQKEIHDQMARFRFMLDYSDETICMNSSPLARGEKVQVIKGPLQGLVGELVNVDGKSKIAVRLNMLGCACVDMPIGYVEPIGEKN